MKEISIQDLKARLSVAIAEAESGQTILITRHNRPVARLTSAVLQHTHVGKGRQRSMLKPVLKQATRGRYLNVLLEDRRGTDEG